MLNDNTVLLGIIALLNGAYLYQQRNQRADFKEMIARIENLTQELMIMKTEHKLFHPDSSMQEDIACKPKTKKPTLSQVAMALYVVFILIDQLWSRF